MVLLETSKERPANHLDYNENQQMVISTLLENLMALMLILYATKFSSIALHLTKILVI